MKREDVAADVAAPIEIDVTGPLADEGAIRRFLQSEGFGRILAMASQVAATAERARLQKLCLDLASQAGQRAKQAGKKGDKGSLGAALVEAEAFRKVARLLTPNKPKAKKARKVTK